jgi:2-methylisocitrate lyase-like PEP mutase family enzyme
VKAKANEGKQLLMTKPKDSALAFRELHIKGTPLILFNIWDAGTAKAVADAGAKAIATGSWSVAAANGFADGENLPFDFALANLERIVNNVDLPVTFDFEGGYAIETSILRENVKRVIAAGAVGVNFEDQIVGGEGLYSTSAQCARIEAVREAAVQEGIALFINARTDVFLQTYPARHNAAQLDEAVDRAKAYADAGASGFFAPGLTDPELIKDLAEGSPLPLNVMVLPETPSSNELAALGVARISYGPVPYRQTIDFVSEAAGKAFSYFDSKQ